MNAALADGGMFEERYEPGLAQSVGLAIAVHVALAVVLFFGVRWQSKPPEAVSVELWSPPPPVVVQQPEPPKPQPRVETPPPPPKPEPVIEKPDIALKAPPKPKPKPEPPKAEAKPKPEPPKPVPTVRDDPVRRQMMEELAREQASLKVDQERTRIRDQLQNDAAGRALADWVGKVRAKVRGNMVVLPDVQGNPEAVFDIVQLPTGEVLTVKLRKSSGSTALDEAIERAIKRSSPLPRPDRPELFSRAFELKYRPKD